MFLLAGLGCSNRGRMTDLAFHSQLFQEVHKPLHRSRGFDPDTHRAWKLGIKLPHVVAFVLQSHGHHLPCCGVEHRQRLLASVQVTSYNSHLGLLGPSTVRVNTETVYSDRREAGVVMTSISAHFQGVASLRASLRILVRRLESRSKRRREVPFGNARRNISSTC